jgi:putative radical SAM enzyme (TIGR03279 family)
LVTINGHALRDVIEYYFHAADERLELEIERAGNRLALLLERDYGDELGLRFTEDVFDGLRRCSNRCSFCFVQQMPPGLRRSLYVKDDDYRYSFLHGNFITLSNWSEEDWERVAEQRLSPLYISVHATDPKTRRQLLCNPRVPDILPQLERLAKMRIEMHTQIVVTPCVNDGEQLERTVRDLLSLHPAVASIGVVPVGLTRYHASGVRPLTPEEERDIMDLIVPWQEANRRELGAGIVYPSDELYLRTGRSIPSSQDYDGFPQLENGIGLVRGLLDEWEELKGTSPSQARSGAGTVVCGSLMAPLLDEICRDLKNGQGVDIGVVPVVNDFFGATVTVSGLLTGGDVLAALGGRGLGEVVFLPRAMFEAEGRVTLDDKSREEIEASLGICVVIASGIGEILEWFGDETSSCPELRSVV